MLLINISHREQRQGYNLFYGSAREEDRLMGIIYEQIKLSVRKKNFLADCLKGKGDLFREFARMKFSGFTPCNTFPFSNNFWVFQEGRSGSL